MKRSIHSHIWDSVTLHLPSGICEGSCYSTQQKNGVYGFKASNSLSNGTYHKTYGSVLVAGRSFNWRQPRKPEG